MIELAAINHAEDSHRACQTAAGHTMPAPGPATITALLESQRTLSAVEEFDHWKESARDSTITSRLASPRYRALLPTQPLDNGQQYAFEVDLDRCSGCKACVTACHTLNGLDEFEAWRDVGLLIGGSRTAPVMQHVTTACHHCLEPACLIACPVNAYEKDPVTGIVKHLDDQCFGCQYCTLACPYDVPKYHPGKGIVRKCDMCSQRLAVGEPPACVQACPHEAIAIRVVDRDQVIEDAEAAVFLPAAPDPQQTYPTTTFKTRRPFPRNLLPADYFSVNPQHAHWPLVVMLVLTQMSVGGFVAGMTCLQLLDTRADINLQSLHAITSLAFGLLAIMASILHLGRPRYAFRAVLGLRHSWLSREIVAFGVFASLATIYSSAQLAITLRFKLAAGDFMFSVAARALASERLGWMVSASGIAGIFCSAMIYIFTRRECWSLTRTMVKFALTAALLGVNAAWLSVLIAMLIWPSQDLLALVEQNGATLCRLIMLLATTKLAFEAALFGHLLSPRMTALRRSAILQTDELSSAALARFALGLLGGVVMPWLLLDSLRSLSPAHLVSFAAMTVLMFAANLAGEILERYLFFAACAAPRMPGGIR